MPLGININSPVGGGSTPVSESLGAKLFGSSTPQRRDSGVGMDEAPKGLGGSTSAPRRGFAEKMMGLPKLITGTGQSGASAAVNAFFQGRNPISAGLTAATGTAANNVGSATTASTLANGGSGDPVAAMKAQNDANFSQQVALQSLGQQASTQSMQLQEAQQQFQAGQAVRQGAMSEMKNDAEAIAANFKEAGAESKSLAG